MTIFEEFVLMILVKLVPILRRFLAVFDTVNEVAVRRFWAKMSAMEASTAGCSVAGREVMDAERS